MPKAQTYQCPNCGGVLYFNAEIGKFKCDFCESEFEEGEVKGDIPISDEVVEKKETKKAESISDFLERAPWEVTADGSVNAVVYSCPSCAAEVVADQSTVSTTCPYCGNNMLVQGLATKDNIPEWVMPFTITQEAAKERLSQHFEHKWYLSRKFNAQLEHLQGMYIPYYLYDMDIKGAGTYIGYETETSTDSDGDTHEERYYYAITRAGHASFERIPVNGSSKMPDGHMDAIAPFPFNKMKPFDASYAAGYLMEVADTESDACQPKAQRLVEASFKKDLEADARHERGVDGIEETITLATKVELNKLSSAVLPVWMMYCTWDDVDMLFAVNGDTGKCVGDLPVQGGRRAATIGGTFVGSAIIGFIIFMLIGTDGSGDTDFRVLIGVIIAVFLITLFVDGHFMGQMRTAVEATNASMSYTAEGLVVDERWCGGRRNSTRSAKKDLERHLNE